MTAAHTHESVNLAIDRLDDLLHQKTRLAIMTALVSSPEMDFSSLKRALGMSDGNLSTHLSVLERNGLVFLRKEFVFRKPHTTILATDKGRSAFEDYIAALSNLVRSARQMEENPE